MSAVLSRPSTIIEVLTIPSSWSPDVRHRRSSFFHGRGWPRARNDTSDVRQPLYTICFAAFGTLGPTATQVVTPGPIRAQVAAMWLMVVNLVGIGLGPTTIALVTDDVLRDEMALGTSIALVGTIAVVAGLVIVWRGLAPLRVRVEAAEQDRGF